jgi:hypothetical protein
MEKTIMPKWEQEAISLDKTNKWESEAISLDSPDFESFDSDQKQDIRDTLFYSTLNDSDPNDVFPYIKEIKQNEKGSRYEDFSKRLSSGLASVGSAIANYASKQGNYYIPSSGGIAPILPKQEEKIQKITQEGQRELAKSADFLWRIANDPSLAMTHNDLFAKASGMIAETLTYILATTAGGLMAGPAGAFGVGAIVEGNNTYRSAQDYFREQNGGQPLTQEQEIKAQKLGVAGGLAKGAIEGVGFGSVSKLFNIVSGKLKSKLLTGVVDFTAATISEALEEGSQELVDVGLEKTYKEVDWKESITRTLGAMAGGAFLGGAVKGGGIAFQQSMLMANKKPAKIPEEYLVKEDTVSQPTESVTQTEQTTTDVTQSPTPAVEPQTMAEGEVGTKQPKNIKNPFEESVVQNPVFHGTTKQFDVFEEGYGKDFKTRGIQFTDNLDVAKAFTGESPNEIIKEVYLDIKNPLIVDANGSHWTEINFEGKVVNADDFADIARKRGNDGVIIKNISDVYPLKGNTYIVLNSNQIKSVNPQQPTPPVKVQPEKVKTERIPQEIFPEIQGEGETKVRGLAKSISDMMDNEDLRLAAADETYQVSSQKKRLNENAAVLVVNEPDRAKRIALAQEAPNTKDGVFPEDVYTALRNKARIEGDVDTQIQLMKSPIAKSATEMGRRIQALDTGEERDPVRAGQDLIAAKEKAFEKKTGKKVKEAVKKEAKKIKKKVKETMLSKQDWHDFIASLQC